MFGIIGDGLTDAEVITLNTIVQSFQTTLGRQIWYREESLQLKRRKIYKAFF